MKPQNKKKNTWDDHLTRKARKDNYPARSVYKLEEIQKKTKIIKKGQNILDLGSAPGSWLLYASEVTGNKGRVVGIDLKPVTIKLPAHAQAYTGDILSMDTELLEKIGKDYNLVISDMAPDTTGNKNVDAARSYNLSEAALNIAGDLLLPGGNFICKIFQGSDFEQFLLMVKTQFSKYKIFKPQSSRKASKEIFIIGLGKK
ncbi:Ribosomal RNA large subunit methyltransferase E (23S rRNA methyltransferase) [Desulfonema limicola]|uniref:Ribosomal RNA large subunit methyltransferase E n=1 Tax=Desulfonema limicola TaxID=45656 RepID=A0A975GHX7_9BACT|nr:RlmE family RNA methyltransferase [Desulfonema limicola]QTA81824.1 Ribosomal RNA large subunit methyltransferase E (23S rRNA methyltransferase) [Desulfonema limicola]